MSSFPSSEVGFWYRLEREDEGPFPAGFIRPVATLPLGLLGKQVNHVERSQMWF